MRIILTITGMILPALLLIVGIPRRWFRAALPYEMPLSLYLGYTAITTVYHALTWDVPTRLVAATSLMLMLICTLAILAHATKRQTTITDEDTEQSIIALALLIALESAIHLIARTAGIASLWIGDATAWRVQLIACDWMIYNQIILAAIPLIAARAHHNHRWHIALALMTLTLFWSGQRSAWLAAAAIAAIHRSWSTTAAAIGGHILIFACCFALWSPLVLADRAHYARTHPPATPTAAALTTDMSRGEMWHAALEAWRTSPIIGTGHYVAGSLEAGYIAYHPHNLPLEILTKHGIVGMLLWLWLWTTALKSQRNWHPTAIAWAASFVVLSLFASTLWIVWLYMLTLPTKSCGTYTCSI